MSENELERTGSCADDYNTIKNDDHGDANPEACLQQLICFDKYLDEHVLIKRDSSAKEIFAKLVSNQKVLIPKDLATFHIQRKIDVPADMHLLDQYNIFLQNLVDYFPYITLHEEVDEAYKRLESDNKLYDLPDHRVTIGLKNFQNILFNLETPYEPGLREAHRADLLYIINTKCKIQRRSRVKFWKLNDVGDHVYEEFLKSLIMRDYAEVYMHKDNDMMAEWRQEREIYKAIVEEYEEEVLELERKLKCKKEALQILVGEKSKNIQQRKMLEDKLESQDPKLYDVEGYKLEDRFKIETWYFLTKEEAKLHIRFEKYLESCSFITHNSAPAKVISMLKNKPELQEFKSLPTALIKTGVQRRINRLKRLKEHEITMKFFRDMIANDYIKKYGDCSPEDLRSHLKDDKKFSYLNDYDYVTFCHESQRVFGLFPDSFTGDIKGVSSHNLSAAGLKSCDKQVGMSMMAVMNGLGGVDMRNQEEMMKEGKDIEEPGDLDHWFGSHKWRIKGYRVSQLTAAVTFQTKYGEKLKKLPKSGFVRRALNTHKTKRQRLQSHIDIIERDIVKQLQCALLQASAVDNTGDDDYDDNMSENELERTESCADDHNTIKNDDHGDANPEASLQQLLCFDKYLDEHVLIKRDSSAKEICAKLASNQKVLTPKGLATFHIQLHEEVDEAYKCLESDNKLYDLPDHMVTIGLMDFQNTLLNLETPYEPGLREAHRADLLYIINTQCKIERRSRMKFWKLNNVGDHVYKEFLKSLIMRDYAEV